ncbi:MAG: hypothetical protein ACOX6N_01700 [Patescibacteria group bacterium]|jgi:hypothetical protein
MSEIFSGFKIYYSGSIKGSPEPDSELPWKLVRYMMDNGADVLSEHVAARSREEMEEIRTRRTALGRLGSQPWFSVRRQDILWVDQATHLVALVNSPSIGVGMEIQRALDKPKFGLNQTPVLCLIGEGRLPDLSYMVRGISQDESPSFQLKTYGDVKQACQHIFSFLTRQN